MDRLKEIENAVSENHVKKIDEIENCLQKQLMEVSSKKKSTDLWKQDRKRYHLI